MTVGTTERLTITAVNIKPQSCVVTADAWLGVVSGTDPNAVWTASPLAGGVATLHSACLDFRNQPVTRTDTLAVYNKPTVTPNMSGMVPVAVGDSIDISYDSTYSKEVDASCMQCGSSANMKRVNANTLRLFATQLPADTLQHGICFTADGLDGRATAKQCVNVTIVPAPHAIYSVPGAIRAAEVLALHSMPVATYDGTGQSTHPDFMRVAAPWSGGACWMVYTPYFGSGGNLENPSLATSPDCEHWVPAAGVRAPLIDQPANGYNSDPDLMYDARRGCLGVVFRQVIAANIINIMSTCDGVTWSAPRVLLTEPNHSAVSPTVTPGPDGLNRIWYVDAGAVGCSNQSNVIKMRLATVDTAGLGVIQFGPEVATDLAQPGYVIWHMKIRYVPALKEYIAMYAAFPTTTGFGNCLDNDLYIATSADGLHWKTFPAPMLNHLDNRFTFTSLYRASFQYDATTDQFRTIVSAFTSPNWGQYAVVHNFTALTKALNSSLTVASAQLVPSAALVRRAGPRPSIVIGEDHP